VPDHLNLGWRHRASAAVSLLGLLSVARRRPVGAALAAVALVALNRSFYALLLDRRGPIEATVGIGLHALHHAVASASVPVAIVAEGRRAQGGVCTITRFSNEPPAGSSTGSALR
jgi:hypothetical protein